MQIAVTEQGSSIDEQNRESRAMAPVETVEQWFLLKMSSDCSCLTINKIIAANINLDMPVLSLAGCYNESRYVQLAKLDIPFHW